MNLFLMILLVPLLSFASNETYEETDTTTFTEARKSSHNYPGYSDNPLISSSERKALGKFLLPTTHHIKPVLDAIFHTTRATANRQSLVNAGFVIVKDQPRSFILVVKHPALPGYLIKLHLDDDLRLKSRKPGWYWFAKRIIGVNDIAQCIAKNHLTTFKTPKKWVYPLPAKPVSGPGTRKNFILVVEDMQLIPRDDNFLAWHNNITRQNLDELFKILSVCGGSSMRPSNIPFSYDGKLTFIDTEYPKHAPDFVSIRPYLNEEMRAYWDQVVANGVLKLR